MRKPIPDRPGGNSMFPPRRGRECHWALCSTICGVEHSLWAWVLKKTSANWSMTRGGTQDEMTSDQIIQKLAAETGCMSREGVGGQDSYPVMKLPRRKKKTMWFWKSGGGGQGTGWGLRDEFHESSLILAQHWEGTSEKRNRRNKQEQQILCKVLHLNMAFPFSKPFNLLKTYSQNVENNKKEKRNHF